MSTEDYRKHPMWIVPKDELTVEMDVSDPDHVKVVDPASGAGEAAKPKPVPLVQPTTPTPAPTPTSQTKA
jgi:hypothetical protein